MSDGRTVLVEPDPTGHRFQWVAHLVRAGAHEGPVLLLTSNGATETAEFETFLADLPVEADEVFDGVHPSAKEMGAAVLASHRSDPVRRFVVMDADQMLKRWWLDAPRELRQRAGGPACILMMTRFPSRLPYREPRLFVLWLSKLVLSALATIRGSAQRVAYIAGRDQLRPGLLAKRVRDPAICNEHARDRATLRTEFGLPQDRRLVAILGMIDERKCVPLVCAAVVRSGDDVDLLLAGGVAASVAAWIDDLAPEVRDRIHVRDSFLSDRELDAYTASADVVTIVQLNPGPSGIMGKAQAAGVPVLSAGSRVRRREMDALGSGVHTEATADAIAAGLRTLLARGSDPVPPPPSMPTAVEFAQSVFGTTSVHHQPSETRDA